MYLFSFDARLTKGLDASFGLVDVELHRAF